MNMKLSKELGGQPKIWEGPWPTQGFLYNRHCGVIIALTYIARQWKSYHENFSFLVT